jgi:uncharacterized RDD family membrane protein YckC/outer membrane protein assembly factor BamB
MYCPKCGLYAADDIAPCLMCGQNLSGVAPPASGKVLVDLRQYSVRALLFVLKTSNNILTLLLAPLFFLLYVIHKLTRSPFWTTILNHPTPRYQTTDLEQLPQLHTKAFQEAAAYFAQQGFEPLLDLEDVSLPQANIHRLFVNPQQNTYGAIYLNKATRRVSHILFFAITTNKTYLAVDNAHTFSLHYPANMMIRHFPDQSAETIHQEFLHILSELDAPPRTLPLNYLMPIGYAIRKISVETGVRQGVFQLRSTAVSVCYQHPASVAVRVCDTCHTALCEACYTLYQERVYCQKCLPVEALAPAPRTSPVEGFWFAGVSIRIVAGLLDWLLLGMIAVGGYFGAQYTAQNVLPGRGAAMLPMLIVQLLVVLVTLWYLILPVHLFGGTLGKRLLGLRVIDRHGQRPEIQAALVRFAYHLASGLFLFPLIGYLFIPFRKTKQGLHDQLAETFVITKQPRLKALLAWALIAAGVIGGGWFLAPRLLSVADFALSMAGLREFSKITLTSKWTAFSAKDDRIVSFVFRGDLGVVSTMTALHGVNLRTGEVVWNNPEFKQLSFQHVADDNALPLIALQYHSAETSTLIRLDPTSGAALWTQPVTLPQPQIALDADTIFVYDTQTVQAYAPDGKRQWERQFTRGLDVAGIMLNQGVLVMQSAAALEEDDEENAVPQTLTYLDRKTGKALWEQADSPYSPGYAIGNGYQVVYTHDWKMALMSLPTQKIVWERADRSEYIQTHALTPAPKKGAELDALYLYSNSGIIQAATGKTVFSYPEGMHVGGVTEQWLVLLPGPQATDVLVVDKFTGAEAHRLPGKGWINMLLLAEDSASLWLGVTRRTGDSAFAGVMFDLVQIQKATFDLREIEIGKNFGAFQLKLFLPERLLVIPTYQKLGGYELPAQ